MAFVDNRESIIRGINVQVREAKAARRSPKPSVGGSIPSTCANLFFNTTQR